MHRIQPRGIIRFIRSCPPTRLLSVPIRHSFTTDAKQEKPIQGVLPSSNVFSELNEAPGDTFIGFTRLSEEPFSKEITSVLLGDLNPLDVEVKPDGQPYLPEIKFRRILNKAFGPGGWALVPRGPHSVINKTLSREYALFALGRFVACARGDQDFYKEDELPTKTEGVKSNALTRCCKDLGIASELWDPSFILQWKTKYAVLVAATNISRNTKTMVWKRKDRPLEYPYKETK